MKTLIVLLLSCASLFAGETLIPLKSGETNFVSYGLSCLVSDSRSASNGPAGANLVLTLRNDGAKWMDTDSITVEDFSLRDANGQEMKIYLFTPSQSMAYGEATVIMLRVANAADAPQPWTLHLKSKAEAHHKIDLSISDIEPRRSP
jgi:hypothetical protein